MFNDFFNLGSGFDSIFKSWNRPLTESNGYKIKDTEKGQLIIINVVGIDKDELTVIIEGSTLKVKGKTRLKEIDFVTETNFSIPIRVHNLKNIEYELKNGYLYVYLNAKEDSKTNIKISYKG